MKLLLGEQILKDFPNNAFVMNMFGLANFNVGKTDALDWLKAYEITPGNLETASNWRYYFTAKESMQRLYQFLKLSSEPNLMFRNFFNYAIALEKAGFLDKAESTYEKIVKLRGDFGPAHYNAGLLMQKAIPRKLLVI